MGYLHDVGAPDEQPHPGLAVQATSHAAEGRLSAVSGVRETRADYRGALCYVVRRREADDAITNPVQVAPLLDTVDERLNLFAQVTKRRGVLAVVDRAQGDADVVRRGFILDCLFNDLLHRA